MINHEYAKELSSFCEDEEFERVKNDEGSVRLIESNTMVIMVTLIKLVTKIWNRECH